VAKALQALGAVISVAGGDAATAATAHAHALAQVVIDIAGQQARAAGRAILLDLGKVVGPALTTRNDRVAAIKCTGTVIPQRRSSWHADTAQERRPHHHRNPSAEYIV